MGDYSEYKDMRSPDAIATSIIFTRRHPGNKFLSFLIVEGSTDDIFFKMFTDTNKCRIRIAGNKAAAIQVLSILEKENLPGVLAIVDADFDFLEGKSLSSPNLILTDTHDLETMIIKSPALEKVLNAYGSEDKINQLTRDVGKDVRTLLLECSIPIGYLRWLSLREGLLLKFENLDFGRFIRDGLTINVPELIRRVKNHSQRLDIADIQIMSGMQAIHNDVYDPWHVCCGHDLIGVLSIGLRKAIGTSNPYDVKPMFLESILRIAFERSHFYETRLYASIKQWEKANEPFLILADE